MLDLYNNRISIIVASTQHFGQNVCEHLLTFLNDEEQSRLERISLEESRREYLIAHGMARWVISHCIGEKYPAQVQIVRRKFGKPELAFSPRLAFSISHCAGAALFAIADARNIGADIESANRFMPLKKICNVAFSAEEQKLLKKKSREAIRTAVRWWTVKEALIKADGRGLGIDLSSISCADGGKYESSYLILSPSLKISNSYHQGAVGLGLKDYWIAWANLGERCQLESIYREWRGGEQLFPLKLKDFWSFSSHPP